MSIEKCPTCGGQKTVSKPPWIAGDMNEWVSSSMEQYLCPTCDGKGYVEIRMSHSDSKRFIMMHVTQLPKKEDRRTRGGADNSKSQ